MNCEKVMRSETGSEGHLWIGDKMYMKGFVAANDGNISVKIPDDIIIVNPAGVSKGGISTDYLVKMKLDSTVIGRNKPSSTCFNRICYCKDSTG